MIGPSDQRSPLDIALISESVWTVRDHGVHTAFVQQAQALRGLGHRVVLNSLPACYEADLTIVHSPGPFSLAALRMSRGAKVAMAHVTPGTLHESLKGEAAWGAALKPWLRAFYRAARVVVAVSPATARELRQMSVGGIEIITSFLGVDCVGRPKQATLRGQSRRKLVLGVGQLQPRKGIDDFARVAAQVPDHDFVWVGGRPFGPLTAGGLNGRQLRRLATRNLRFTGRVSDASLQALYERANAFLFLSRQENFGQVVVEAANHRTPLLLSRIPAFEDHFQEGAALIEPAQAPNRLANLFSSGELSDELASRSHTLSTRFSATRAASDLISQLHEAQLVRESQPA